MRTILECFISVSLSHLNRCGWTSVGWWGHEERPIKRQFHFTGISTGNGPKRCSSARRTEMLVRTDAAFPLTCLFVFHNLSQLQIHLFFHFICWIQKSDRRSIHVRITHTKVLSLFFCLFFFLTGASGSGLNATNYERPFY